jgi:hypothetical protein
MGTLDQSLNNDKMEKRLQVKSSTFSSIDDSSTLFSEKIFMNKISEKFLWIAAEKRLGFVSIDFCQCY